MYYTNSLSICSNKNDIILQLNIILDFEKNILIFKEKKFIKN